MTLRIEWDIRAEKELDKLPKKVILKILEKVEGLREQPYHKKLTDSESSYRMRVGDYRIIYEIDKMENLVIIYRIGDRKNVYKR